jgi:hypothetical protein
MENDLKFSGVTPVIINYTGNADDLYAPVKTSSCDVNIVSDHILDDLYTSKKDEIYMKVEKKEPVKIKVMKFSDDGSAASTQIDTDTYEYYTIWSTNVFYTDINGDFRYCGYVKDANNNTEGVNLKYDYATHKWIRNNDWNLEAGNQYFYVDGESYRVYSENSVYMIQQWNNSTNSWGTATNYLKYEGSQSSNCTYWCQNIVHYADGNTELLWGNKRYSWNTTRKAWVKKTSYSDVNGATYASIYGEYHLKVKVGLTVVDAFIVNGLSGTDQADISEYWIVIPDRLFNTFSCYIPLTVQYRSQEQVFTDDGGYVYYLTTNGEVYHYSLDINEWVKWITFEGDLKANSAQLDYVFPDHSPYNKAVVIKYQDTGNNVGYFHLTNLQHPTVYYEEEVVPGEYTMTTVWEGYKMPNTYTQDVTQNLDTISMTAIDPLSILKYVKINKIMTKPAIVSYKQLIGKAIAYVMLSGNKLRLERQVIYGSTYIGNNGLLDLKCQVSNFWDESGEPSTVYEMIEEILRPFCLTMVYVDNCFIIYNPSKTEGTSIFDEYTIRADGNMTLTDEIEESPEVYDFDENDWISNNVQNPTLEIGPTYDKVTAIASTSIPSYSTMVYDVVDYNQRDKYDILQLNVQRNKTKGYRYMSFNSVKPYTEDVWFYIWNGVYTDEIYHLESHGGYVNGYLNINKAYDYLTGNAGNPSDYGSILNFYGGGNNPTATGKEQLIEKSVDVKRSITAYAADNGTPLEFLELSDLEWGWSRTYDPESGWDTPNLSKKNPSNAKFGSSIDMQESNKITYHQEYENMYLSSVDEKTIDLSLTQSYSRTGINTNIDIYQNNTASGTSFELSWDDDEQKWRAECSSISTVNYFPGLWDAASVKVNNLYFNRYNTSGTLLRPSRVQPVWDKRRINMYVRQSGGGILQFNGKEWVSGSQVSDTNSFFLMKLMNGEQLFHTEFKYNVIETSDGEHYSLTDERFVYYTDEAGGVTDRSVSGGHTYYCDVYKSEANEWNRWIDSCGEGKLSIKMPLIDDASATIIIDVYNSTMLGMTGQNNTAGYNYSEAIYWKVEGQGRHWDDDQQAYVYVPLRESNCVNYGSTGGASTYILFVPVNASYVKAEHLDLDINVSVPESNLGQMFSESDIKYTLDNKQNYVEEFEGPTFRTNTYNQLVASSYSYIMFGNGVADPGGFIVDGFSTRPECYTVQAYMNWLSKIRKVYGKTLVPLKEAVREFSIFRTVIKTPEISDHPFLVFGDSWDLKTNRHSIQAIEAHNLDVDYVTSCDVMEIPRQARAARWNLPTAHK